MTKQQQTEKTARRKRLPANTETASTRNGIIGPVEMRFNVNWVNKGPYLETAEELNYQAAIKRLVARKEFKEAETIYLTAGQLTSVLLHVIRLSGKKALVQPANSYHIQKAEFPGTVYRDAWRWKEFLPSFQLMLLDCDAAAPDDAYSVKLPSQHQCDTVIMVQDLGLANCPKLGMVKKTELRPSVGTPALTGIKELITINKK